MPFRSKSQERYLFWAEHNGKTPRGIAERWAKVTPKNKNLPEHVKKSCAVISRQYLEKRASDIMMEKTAVAINKAQAPAAPAPQPLFPPNSGSPQLPQNSIQTAAISGQKLEQNLNPNSAVNKGSWGTNPNRSIAYGIGQHAAGQDSLRVPLQSAYASQSVIGAAKNFMPQHTQALMNSADSVLNTNKPALESFAKSPWNLKSAYTIASGSKPGSQIVGNAMDSIAKYQPNLYNNASSQFKSFTGGNLRQNTPQ